MLIQTTVESSRRRRLKSRLLKHGCCRQEKKKKKATEFQFNGSEMCSKVNLICTKIRNLKLPGADKPLGLEWALILRKYLILGTSRSRSVCPWYRSVVLSKNHPIQTKHRNEQLYFDSWGVLFHSSHLNFICDFLFIS